MSTTNALFFAYLVGLVGGFWFRTSRSVTFRQRQKPVGEKMLRGAGHSLSEELESKRIFIAVPSLFLIQQTLEVWARESLAKKRDIRWICVCSDETVKNVSKDDITVLTQDLGVEVKIKTDQITKWLRNQQNEKGRKISFVVVHHISF